MSIFVHPFMCLCKLYSSLLHLNNWLVITYYYPSKARSSIIIYTHMRIHKMCRKEENVVEEKSGHRVGWQSRNRHHARARGCKSSETVEVEVEVETRRRVRRELRRLRCLLDQASGGCLLFLLPLLHRPIASFAVRSPTPFSSRLLLSSSESFLCRVRFFRIPLLLVGFRRVRFWWDTLLLVPH